MLSLVPSNCGGSRVYSLGSLKANVGQREVPRDSCEPLSPLSTQDENENRVGRGPLVLTKPVPAAL